MPAWTAPSVYLQEVSALPPSVVEVATAVPAFVGYTAKADQLAPGNLTGRPVRITSLLDFGSAVWSSRAAMPSVVSGKRPPMWRWAWPWRVRLSSSSCVFHISCRWADRRVSPDVDPAGSG